MEVVWVVESRRVLIRLLFELELECDELLLLRRVSVDVFGEGAAVGASEDGVGSCCSMPPFSCSPAPSLP